MQATNKSFLVKRLALPFSLLTASILWGSFYAREPWQGFLVNIAAAFVGSILTVFYVDAVLQRHQAANWAEVNKRVTQRVARLSNISVSSIRRAFRLSIEIFDQSALLGSDATKMNQESLRVAEKVLLPMVSCVRRMNEAEWKTFASEMQYISAYADRLLTLFAAQYRPEVVELILDIQESAEHILAGYSIVPDLLGVPPERLPKKRDGSSTEAAQRGFLETASSDVASLLRKCASLLRELGFA